MAGTSAPVQVSVIVIFRDAERFLDEAIASVFAQTYTEWELLLVDDGSVDTSPVRAVAWAAQHPDRVRYVQHPGGVNRGMSASRNLGICYASGEYLAFLDADDVWVPTTLEEQVGLLQVHAEAAMVYGPIQWWYSWTGRPEAGDRDYVEQLGVPADRLVQPPTLVPLFLRDKAAVPSGLLIRREALHQVGGFEPIFRAEYEDQALCAKVCLRLPVFASSQCWYRYRQHADSCVSVGEQAGRARATRLFFLKWLAAYLWAQCCRDPRVWRALSYELWRWNYPLQYRVWRRGQQLAGRLIDRFGPRTHTAGQLAR